VREEILVREEGGKDQRSRKPYQRNRKESYFNSYNLSYHREEGHIDGRGHKSQKEIPKGGGGDMPSSRTPPLPREKEKTSQENGEPN